MRIHRSHVPLNSSPANSEPPIWEALVAHTRPRARTWAYALALLMAGRWTADPHAAAAWGGGRIPRGPALAALPRLATRDGAVPLY
jgi:hypothetical protein